MLIRNESIDFSADWNHACEFCGVRATAYRQSHEYNEAYNKPLTSPRVSSGLHQIQATSVATDFGNPRSSDADETTCYSKMSANLAPTKVSTVSVYTLSPQ